MRLRTGTPPRLDKNTIDYSKCELQDTKNEIYIPMHLPNRRHFGNIVAFNQNEQIDCYLTKTTSKTQEIVMNNLHLLPDYKTESHLDDDQTVIESKPPRYCPSVDAKIYRFPEKPYH